MSDNEELILGFCPLPEVRDDPTESNGEKPASPHAEYDGEVITGDIGDYQASKNHNEAESNAEFNQSQPNTNVIVKNESLTDEDNVEYTHVISQNDTQDGSNSETATYTQTIVMADGSGPVKVSANLVDFINQAGAELMAGTILEEDDSDSQPAKKRRKVLPKGTFQCAECRIMCEDFASYSSHMGTHSDVPLYTCQKCLYIFQDKAQYDVHTAQTCKAAGNAKDKECAVCKKNFKYDSHLREHIICMHNKTPHFSCPICGQNITCWKRSIERHMANHANNIKCPSCGSKGENIESVDAHILESGDNHLQCRTCEYSTSSRHDFFSHVNVHIPKVDVIEPMACFKCSHRFQRTSEFNNHVRLFCQFREVLVSDVEATKANLATNVNEATKVNEAMHPIIHTIPGAEIMSAELQDGSSGIVEAQVEAVNDPSKQVITLPEGVNNNTFIPITLSTGGDDLGQGLGTTVILIPQMLLMQNGGALFQDGTHAQILGDGQNDQVIYLECFKPDQQGILPTFEVPADKSGQEGIYANHLQQSVLQTLQGSEQLQALQHIQSVVQSAQAVAQPVQSVVQPVQSVVQSVVQPIQTVLPLQSGQSMQTIQAREHPLNENINQGNQDEEEEEVRVISPPTSRQSNTASSLTVQNVYSLASNTTQNTSTVDSVIQQVIDQQSGPPALVCSVCNEVLRDSETYETHVKQHDKAKSKPLKPNVVIQKKGSSAFNCDQCGQGFAAKHHLEQHTITFHSDVAGIVCPVCRVGMASEKMSLNEHLAKAHKLRVEPSGKLTDCSEN